MSDYYEELHIANVQTIQECAIELGMSILEVCDEVEYNNEEPVEGYFPQGEKTKICVLCNYKGEGEYEFILLSEAIKLTNTEYLSKHNFKTI